MVVSQTIVYGKMIRRSSNNIPSSVETRDGGRLVNETKLGHAQRDKQTNKTLLLLVSILLAMILRAPLGERSNMHWGGIVGDSVSASVGDHASGLADADAPARPTTDYLL